MKPFLTLIVLNIVLAIPAFGVTTFKTSSEKRQKIMLIEELRSAQIQSYELEDRLYGSAKYNSKGMLGDLKECLREADLSEPENETIERITDKEGNFQISFRNLDHFVTLPDQEIKREIEKFFRYKTRFEIKEQDLSTRLENCRIEIAARKEIKFQMAKTQNVKLRKFNISGFEREFNVFIKEGRKLNRDIDVKNLIIKFGSPESAGCEPENGLVTYACCTRNVNQPPTITVSKGRWDQGSKVEHERLILHEIGHCLLNRTHREDKNSDSKNLSLMFPIIDRDMDSYYSAHRDEYIKELFKIGSGPKGTKVPVMQAIRTKSNGHAAGN